METDIAQATLFLEQARNSPVHVVGVGDAGCRTASEIWRRRIRGVSVTCVDTDALSLDRSQSDHRVLLGAASMHGFGSGGDSDAVTAVTENQLGVIGEAVSGATCVIVIAGLAGGTGSGAAPVISRAVRSTGTLVVAIPIEPLEFEPIGVQLAAADTLARLRESCNGLLEIPRPVQAHQSSGHAGIALRQIFDADRSFAASFVRTISTIVSAGPDRCDANSGDLCAILRDGVSTVFGTATGFGHTGVAEATCVSLDTAIAELEDVRGIERAVVLIESGPDISVSHIATATSLIETRIGSHTELHTAVRRSRLLGNNVRVSFIASVSEKKYPVAVTPFRAKHPFTFDTVVPGEEARFRPTAINHS